MNRKPKTWNTGELLRFLEERDRLFFEAMMRIVDRELPGYRN